jgi:uncharacterized membrane protein YgaE (UPF0421/DUF939 family)
MEIRRSTATGTLPRVEEHGPLERLRRFLSRRSRAGWMRVRSSAGHAGLTSLAAVAAYWFAEAVLGHEGPLFAATATLVGLGFAREPRLRRVLEVSVGCTLGILIGDALMLGLGRGIWQAAIVLFASVMIARFLDPGALFSTQMSIQAVLVVLLPAPADGPFSRSLDALVGAGFALAVAFLTPHRTRSSTAKRLQSLYDPMVSILRDLSTALRSQDSRTAWMALITGRGTQSVLDELRREVKMAREVTTYSPLERRSKGFVTDVAYAVDRSDLAIRSLRIVARRVVTLIDSGALTDGAAESLSSWFDEAADAVQVLHRSFDEPTATGRREARGGAREALGAAASRLDPRTLGGGSLHGEALVMLLRPMMVDLLEATGCEHEDAVGYLPRV